MARGLHVLLVVGFFSLALPSWIFAETSFETFKRERTAALARCNGPFKDRTPAKNEFDQLLASHLEWIRSLGNITRVHDAGTQNDQRRANLCGARLHNWDLSRLNLSGANLAAADLSATNMVGTSLWGANLGNVFATRTDLSSVALNTGSLEMAWLQGASLHEATLSYVNLRGSFLLDTDLGGSNVAAVDLKDAVYEPRPGELPQFWTLVRARNLAALRFETSPHALHELRAAFKNAGLQAQERQLTYAIKHTERMKAGPTERALSYVFFELTTEWGRTPSRAIYTLGLLIPLFAVPYGVALRLRRRATIWRARVDPTSEGIEVSEPLHPGWLGAVFIGFYFSVLSAFRIGWREFNIGDWIARMQPGDYTFRATGWVRTISGLQSLVSLYLLAIWALTYFGRPFE